MKIGVLGAGTWGMALARMLANDHYDVMVWSAIESEIDELSATRAHKNLPGMAIPQSIIYRKVLPQFARNKGVHCLSYSPPGQQIRACTPYLAGA